MKVCLVGSSGGHLTHLYMLKPFWKDKERFWVTFDKEDAKRYGFTHFYTMYSRHYNFPEADSIDYDAVYIGSDKGRYNMLTELKAKCQHANLYIDMLIGSLKLFNYFSSYFSYTI